MAKLTSHVLASDRAAPPWLDLAAFVVFVKSTQALAELLCKTGVQTCKQSVKSRSTEGVLRAEACMRLSVGVKVCFDG